jgi:RNA polymerase sigma factor (sigma-70 family)
LISDSVAVFQKKHTIAHLASRSYLVRVTLVLILAAATPPEDVGAPDRYANSPAARRARDDAEYVEARDGEWAARLRSTDTVDAHRALTDLMHAYADRLIRFAYGFVGSADAAEDIVQNVFIGVWDRRGTIHPDESLRAYLFTSVRRTALNVLKRRTIETRFVSQSMHDTPRWQTLAADDRMEANDSVYEIHAAMARLTERRSTALRLRYEEQLPFAVVAQVMGLSEKSVKHLVTRAVEEVRGYLGL